MNLTREEKKAEAIRRMKEIGILREIITQFEIEGRIAASELPFGAYYWLKESELDLVDAFEKQFHAVVYTAARSYTEIGHMLSLFYVSDHIDEWEQDCKMLQKGMTFAYVVNHTYPEFSEFGTIEYIKTPAHGLIRIS